ncbi:MAG: hypothetical protein VX000_02935, partial [Myxococcota bacterium]|nr:hypothetical protein [Myxococcota bacterium]
AAQALGALPATLLGATEGGSATTALRRGHAVPGLPDEAAFALLGAAPAGAAPASLGGRGVPDTARGLQLWLVAADAVGVPTAPVEDAVLAGGDAPRTEVVVRWRLQSGHPESAALGLEHALEGPGGLPPLWWPDALDAAGHRERGREARSRYGSPLDRATLLVRSGSASGLAAVEAIGPPALHLRPLALLHAGRPCDAVAAFVTLRYQSVGPVPGAGAVGYAGASAGCWTADALPVLRAAQAEAPADGRLAHALGRVLLDLGDPTMARRFFAQARRALPEDALLTSDIVRLSRATEDRP